MIRYRLHGGVGCAGNQPCARASLRAARPIHALASHPAAPAHGSAAFQPAI